MTDEPMPATDELRLLALSRIDVQEGFNPRSGRDRRAFEQLVASIRADGVLQPVLVAPDGNGGYRLVAGEGRYLAAAEAGCTEIPALVRDTDERTGGLELALADEPRARGPRPRRAGPRLPAPAGRR